jgi:hypothetical protein
VPGTLGTAAPGLSRQPQRPPRGKSIVLLLQKPGPLLRIGSGGVRTTTPGTLSVTGCKPCASNDFGRDPATVSLRHLCNSAAVYPSWSPTVKVTIKTLSRPLEPTVRCWLVAFQAQSWLRRVMGRWPFSLPDPQARSSKLPGHLLSCLLHSLRSTPCRWLVGSTGIEFLAAGSSFLSARKLRCQNGVVRVTSSPT